MGWWLCKTPLFTFNVMEVDDNEFTMYIDSKFNTCIHKDETYTTEKGAKVGAQEWLEEKLNEYVDFISVSNEIIEELQNPAL